jgi:hypothetical protein
MAEGRDLLAGDNSSGGGRDLLAAPKAPVNEAPGFGEKAGAFAYGLATGIPGSVGDIEAMLPGGPEVGAKGKGALKGYETVFPTTQNIQSGLTKLGVPEPRKEVSGYKTAGEIAPAVVAGGKGLYELAKYGGKKIGSMISGGKDLAAELQASTAGKTAQEIAAAEKRAGTAESRAGVAGKIAEREAGKGETAYGQLPGVSTTTEAGVAKAIPEAEDTIGQRLKSKADEVYTKLREVRAANAEKNKAAAFNSAKQKELAGAKVEDTEAYKQVMKNIQGMLNDPDTKLAVATLDPIKNPLLSIKRALDPRYVDEAGIVRGKPVSFQGMEDLRRFLRDRSYGLPAEGFDAINQQRAGKLADSIEKVMEEFSPGIKTFINQYRKDSEPLRNFQSKLGKSLIGEQKGTTIATTAAQDIPKKVFGSPEGYANFVDAIGGDTKLAQSEAQRYFASQLEGKTATQARKFLADNRTMLKETNSYEMAGKYVQQLEQAEKRGATATARGETRANTAVEQRKLSNKLRIIQSDIDRADKIVSPKEKINYINEQAQKLAQYLPLEQRNQFLTEVQGVVNAEQKKLAIKKWTQIALGGAGLYTTGHIASGYLGK